MTIMCACGRENKWYKWSTRVNNGFGKRKIPKAETKRFVSENTNTITTNIRNTVTLQRKMTMEGISSSWLTYKCFEL